MHFDRQYPYAATPSSTTSSSAASYRSISSRRLLPIALSSLGLACLLLVASSTAFASTDDVVYRADAFGTLVTLSQGEVYSDKSAWSAIGCSNGAGERDENTQNHMALSPILGSGVMDSYAESVDEGTLVVARASARVHHVHLLEGLVTATEVHAVSETRFDGQTVTVDGSASRFVDLAIAGIPILIQPGVNTTLDLAGIGRIVLNEEKTDESGQWLTRNMIHIIVDLPNPFDIPVGTNIIVGHARSALETGVLNTMGGAAYALEAFVGEVVEIGQTALVRLPCTGTGGEANRNQLVGIALGDLAQAATVGSKARGVVDETRAKGKTASAVEDLSLLGGLVTADLVRANAIVYEDENGPLAGTRGNRIANLRIGGELVLNGDVEPNTVLEIPGVGELWLHRVFQGPTSVEVRMIELIVTLPNELGLELGTTVRVAVARAHLN